MYRQSPSRNQRSKGIRVKHVLQICLLVAVCFWLIYQIKHSQDKKKEFDESDAKTSMSHRTSNEDSKLGRKDIRPLLDEPVIRTGEEEDREDEEIEDNKHEVEEEEEEKKDDEKTDVKEGGNDEIDEHEEENSDADENREDEFIDEEKEKEKEESEESENEGEDSENSQRKDKETALEDDGDGSTHEAREENYKADDVSSAVTQDAKVDNPEQGNKNLEKLSKNETSTTEQISGETNTEETSADENKTGLRAEGGKILKSDDETKLTDRGQEVNTTSEIVSSSNNTMAEGSNVNIGTNSSSTEIRVETHDISLQNGTESSHDAEGTIEFSTTGEESNLRIVALEQTDNSSLPDDNHPDPNVTSSIDTKDAESKVGELPNSLNNSDSNIEESKVDGNNTDSLPDKKDETEAEESEINTSSEDAVDSTVNDLIDSSDSFEKDVHVDLETLPETETTGTNSDDDTAAE